ncbi:hypothetical protein B0O99DRAFT_631808 [Bisporella sp. PMI_857]|nr:hypothetical protein B0O99DRAFT_631808 [Bisporella sp. PMI_857]
MELPGLHGSAGRHLIVCFTSLEQLLLVFLYEDEGREEAVKKAIVRLLAKIKRDKPDYNVPKVKSCHRGDLD